MLYALLNNNTNTATLTELGLGCEVIRSLRWLALTGLVDSLDAELVSLALRQVLHLELRLVALRVAVLHPLGRELVFAFNDVTGDGGTTILFRSLPLEFTPCPVIILDFWLAWFAWRICKWWWG